MTAMISELLMFRKSAKATDLIISNGSDVNQTSS